MSALEIQSEPSPEDEGTYGTKDYVLFVTLGTLGFKVKYFAPALIIVSAVNVVAVVDRNSGRMEDCAHGEFKLEADIVHEVFGRLSASTVFLAIEIAKLNQKVQTREISGAEAFKLSQLRERWKHLRIGPNAQNMAGTLLWMVQMLYDQTTNLLVGAAAIKGIRENPLIAFAKKLYRGVAYAVEPLEVEPQAQRRSEKFMRR